MRFYLEGQKVFDGELFPQFDNINPFIPYIVGFWIDSSDTTKIHLIMDNKDEIPCTGKYIIDKDGEPCMILERII